MIEIEVQNYLTEATGLPVSLEVPDPVTEGEFIVLEKIGSSEDDGLQTAMVVVQSYAPTLYRAAKANELVKTAMKAMPETEDVFRVELNSDYNYTDTRTKRYRYQAVFDIYY